MKAQPKRPAQPTTVDAYLSTLSDDKRAALERLRRTIRAIVPLAEECISYRMPAFRLDGKVLVWFAAAARHCSFFPGGVVEDFADELSGYAISKGTVRFLPHETLPTPLVRKLIKARIVRIAARSTRPARGSTGGR